MKDNEDIVQCPCHHICMGLGIQTNQWCRYRKSDLPPPGMHRFDPKEFWCPRGVQANVLLLGYLLAKGDQRADALSPALDRVRWWAEAERAGDGSGGEG